MVTKLWGCNQRAYAGLILAKNHMVTKQKPHVSFSAICLILAKNHMVTKLIPHTSIIALSLILAKNHMVTKHY